MSEQEFRCPRCHSDQFLSVSLNGGYTRVPQCVPCGHHHPDYFGHGWKSGQHDDGWTKRDPNPAPVSRQTETTEG